MKKYVILALSLIVIGCTSSTSREGPYIDEEEFVRRLSANLYYPQEARKSNLEGTAMVKVDIGRNGSVIGVTIVESSGHTILDTAATRTLLATKFPRHNAPHPITVVIPMIYQLEGS